MQSIGDQQAHNVTHQNLVEAVRRLERRVDTLLQEINILSEENMIIRARMSSLYEEINPTPTDAGGHRPGDN